MNFSKKNHGIVGQNDKIVKKPHKHDANLRKNSTLYFQVGLILTLLATYTLLEMQFKTVDIEISTGEPLQEDPYVFASIIKTADESIKHEKKVKQNKRKIISVDPTIVPDDVSLKDVDPIFTDPTTNGPLINPDDILPLIDKPDDKTYSVLGVEQVPIYPGCEGLASNQERIDCMQLKLDKLVNRKFDSAIMADLGLSGIQRIVVYFKIDKAGAIGEIKVRHSHTRVQREALKVAHMIPQMSPAKQGNKNVEVMYSLPITVKVNY